jgi:glutamate/tyrosine decarboxylase-like PLP-dependent enzyme
MFASEDAHYSVHKMAALLGLGEQNVCSIQTDKAGRMDSLHLETQVQRIIATGAVPFMVVATAGTMDCLQTDTINIFRWTQL